MDHHKKPQAQAQVQAIAQPDNSRLIAGVSALFVAAALFAMSQQAAEDPSTAAPAPQVLDIAQP